MEFETPESKEINMTGLEYLWSKVYAESFNQYGHSKAAKDADKAVKAYKERFKNGLCKNTQF